MAAPTTLKLALILSTVDKATSGLRVVASAMGKVTAAGEKMKKVAESARVARENVDDFTERAKTGLLSVLAPAGELETAMTRLWLSMDPATRTADGLESVRKAAVDWSMVHTQSATEFASATKVMVAESYKEADALAATAAAMRFATANSTEAGSATKGLVTLYKQMGDQTADVGTEYSRLADILTASGQVFSNLNVAEVFDPLKDAAPVAKSAGVSLSQLMVILGQLNAVGIQGGEAGMGFVGVLQSMQPAADKLGFAVAKTADGGTDLIATLRNIEAQFGSVQNMTPETNAKLQEAFGPEGFKGLSFMLGQTEQMSAALGRVESSAGAAASAQAALESTTAGQAKVAQNQLDALKIEVAQGLIPALLQLMPHITAVVTSLAGIARENPQLVGLVGTVLTLAVATGTVVSPIISAVGAFSALGGGALEVGGKIGKFASEHLASLLPAFGKASLAALKFAAALLANPITWIVIAIVAAVALIYVYWEPISEFFSGLWDGITAGFRLQWAALKGIWNSVVGFFTGVFDEVRAAFRVSFVGGIFKVLTLLSPITWFSRAFMALLPWLVAFWPKLRDGFLAGLRTLGQLWVNLVVWVLEALTALPGKILAWHVAFYTWLGQTVLDGLRAVANLWVNLVTWVLEALTSLPARIAAFFITIGQTVIAALGGMGGALLTGITNDLNRVLGWLSSFSLANAGANIVNTLTAGIRSAANAPFEAMKAIVQKVRNLLPFSPAKEGPLRDLHRVKLVETVADSVKAAPLVNAMSGVAGAAMATLTEVPMPRFASMPAAVSAASASNRNANPDGGGGDVTVIFQLDGGADLIPQLEKWVRGNGDKIAKAAKRDADRKKRGAL